MPAAVKLREDFSVEELRALARRSKDANQSPRMLSLAAVREGKDRGEAARIGGMDRQTLRDWVHRFDAAGRPVRSLDARPQAAPVGGAIGRVRENRRGRFSRALCGTLLRKLGFSHISARPRHPAQSGEIVEAYKNFAVTLKAHLADLPPQTTVEIWFQGEARIGQKNGLVHQWARRGTRPRQPADQRSVWRDLSG